MTQQPLTVEQKKVLAFTWILLKTAGYSHKTAARIVGHPADTLYGWFRKYLWKPPVYPATEPTEALESAVQILRLRLPVK